MNSDNFSLNVSHSASLFSKTLTEGLPGGMVEIDRDICMPVFKLGCSGKCRKANDQTTHNREHKKLFHESALLLMIFIVASKYGANWLKGKCTNHIAEQFFSA